MTKRNKKIALSIEIHPDDYEIIERAAAVAQTDLQAFAELAVYRQARNTLAERGATTVFPRHQLALQSN